MIQWLPMKYTIDSVMSLISHIHSKSADFTNNRLSKNGNFVSSHGFILFLLSENGTLTMGELSKRINRDKSTTTVLIKKLSEEGLVMTENDASDSRKKLISLTEKGKEYKKLTSGISQQLRDSCLKNFTDEEKTTLLCLLEKMNSNLSESI